MDITNADIARIFEEIAELLEIGDENPFRMCAYRNAARTVGHSKIELAERVLRGDALPKLPGVGADLGNITELLRLPGLGPKRVRALHDALRIASIADLQKALGGRPRGCTARIRTAPRQGWAKRDHQMRDHAAALV